MDETGDTDNQIERWVNRAGLMLLALVLLGGAWLIIRGPDKPKTAAEQAAKYQPSAADAERMCREHVTNQLKAPSTAKFGDIRTRGFGSEYTVTGWVDAENSFGATLRTRWECTAIHTGGGTWRTASHVR